MSFNNVFNLPINKDLRLNTFLAVPFVAVSFLSALLYSNPTLALTNDQKLYKKAVAAFEKKQFNAADKYTSQLKDYPLYPYLQLRQMRRDIASVSDKQARQFFDHYTTAPFSDDLQRSRLDHSYKQKAWKQYLNIFPDYALSQAKYQCQFATALLKTGKKQQAMQKAETLWQVGRSQDKACDPLFSVWMKAGFPTSKQAVNRFWAGVDKKNFSIAKYAEKFIKDPTALQDTKLMWDVRKDLNKLQSRALLKADNTYHGQILAYGVRQLARKDLANALNIWLRDRDRLIVKAEAKEKLNHYFAMRYAKSTRENAVDVLSKIDPNYLQPKITEWRARVALKHKDWKQVVHFVNNLPEDLQKNDRWVYWKETALQRSQSGYKADYSSILKNRSFYGYLAAEIENHSFSLSREASGITQDDKSRILSIPEMRRIKELLAFDYQYAARLEWNGMTKNLSKRDQHIAAHVAFDWGWHDQAIRGAARIKAWNDTDIRFPSPHKKLFAEWANNREIPKTWAMAIARQESAFHQYAKSRVGARGLMQLMPATAKATAKRYKVPYKTKNDLFKPEVNIALGTAYLSQMMDTFGDSRIYASAAYNAGPHRVKRWLKERGSLPLDIWIETIPFDETRNYVQNVLAFNVIYDVLNNRTPSMLTQKEEALLALNLRGKAPNLYN